jgi:UMP-CMP kinase
MGCAKSKSVEIKPNASGDKPTAFFILGGPGSGKGTQCTKLKEKGFVHLSAGDLLREEAASGSETAAMIQQYQKEGKLVPGEVPV